MKIVLTIEEAAKAKDVNVAWMQKWLNAHGAALVIDGKGGDLTKDAILQVFVNKNAQAITQHQLQTIAEQLGDTNTRRINAVAKVESGSYGGWFSSGHPVILYERHKFWEWVQDKSKRVISWFANPRAGDYTLDANGNSINDSWEKLSLAACKDPLAAFQAISIGKFQVLGRWYRECGFDHPIEMLWAARNDEYAHYKMLRDYIKNVANLQAAFMKISSKPDDCRNFARGYNGPAYTKYDYHTKIAKEMR